MNLIIELALQHFVSTQMKSLPLFLYLLSMMKFDEVFFFLYLIIIYFFVFFIVYPVGFFIRSIFNWPEFIK